MTSPPSGTVTVLFTDLVGSTAMRGRLGDDEVESLRRGHFRLLRAAIEANRGREVKTLGDGVMAVFASALDALDTAVSMQRTVHEHNQGLDADRRLGLRIGLEAGEPVREEDDYFGMPVIVAQRLCACAEGGQILCSELVRGLIGSRGGRSFREAGPFALKGVGDAVPGYEVTWGPAGAVAGAQPQATEERRVCPLPPLLLGAERTAFIGRARELAELRGLWENAKSGSRRLALISGEPGIGKTRLAAEFAALAHAEHATVLYGRAEEETFVRCQPFVEGLRYYAETGASSSLRERAASAAEGLAALAAEMPPNEERERYRLFEEAGAWVAGAAHDAPLVLVLDDLQWADKLTLLLMKHLVSSTSARGGTLLLLGTYREGDLGPEHPLPSLIADLRRQRALDRISLTGLREEDVRTMIATWANEEAPPGLIETIYEQTEGNPFFIEELLRHLAESSIIVHTDEGLRVDLGRAQLAVPEGIQELIGRRLARLSDECNSVLTIASVIGLEFGLDALERASDLPADRLLGLLDEAVAAGTITEVPGSIGHYSFAHSLIYETLYDELTTTRRVRLHGQTLQYADSDGVKLAYEVLGAAGPHMIAVGVSNCPAVRTRKRVTARHWDRMSRNCRVILYDRRGVGFSAAPERGYSLLASIEDVRAVLDAAGAERVVLCGATDGGPLALAFAAHHPERVAGLLLLGTSAKFMSDDDYALGVSPALMESFQRLDPVDRSRAITELTGSRPLGIGGDVIGDVLKRVPPRVWSKIVLAIGTADARPLLARVRVPSLIIHDPGNTYIPVEAASYLHEHLAGSSLEITPDYGTPVWSEALYSRIDAFIRDVTRGGG